jgi:cytochrome P450
MMHMNEEIYPDPYKFDPERWMDPERARKLDRYLVPFTKGNRQCVGMQYEFPQQFRQVF